MLVNITQDTNFSDKMFKLANIEQMPMFIANLQNLILGKHEGTKTPQESDYVIYPSSEAEVAERKLPIIPPTSKKGWLVVFISKRTLIRHHFIKSLHIHDNNLTKYLRRIRVDVSFLQDQ